MCRTLKAEEASRRHTECACYFGRLPVNDYLEEQR